MLALAHGGASGVVKERMEAMGDAMKELSAIMRGQRDYDAESVRALASTIESHGGDALVVQLSDYASALVAAADNEHAVGQAHGSLMGQGQGIHWLLVDLAAQKRQGCLRPP